MWISTRKRMKVYPYPAQHKTYYTKSIKTGSKNLLWNFEALKRNI